MTSILREARGRAGLTQAELAERSGVAQSTISAYESGKRDPGWRLLGRLVQAAGYEVVLLSRRPTPEQTGLILLGLWEFADMLPKHDRRGELPPPRKLRG
ncbi:MAG: helix-turn-helix transcriptional regulator [Actinobacteria bacterium]|nr:helix-turn-helix transcriptional regulator [Actinomycetota bacterium]